MRLCGKVQEGRMTERYKETFGVMDMFRFLTVVMVSWMNNIPKNLLNCIL